MCAWMESRIMSKLPDICFPEDGVGGDAVIAETQGLFGDNAWVVLIPNPRPSDLQCDLIASKLAVKPLAVRNTFAFVVEGERSIDVIRISFNWGPPEWALLGYSKYPDAKMIEAALKETDRKYLNHLMIFDSNILTTSIDFFNS